ncbi:MAG: carbohydrate-binding protein [Melioribacteraceae bacterium]|nr:carbohydrate-binding protein [Melioribacteraceae bacterium]
MIPGKLFAVDYDFGKRGSAYNDAVYQNTKGQGGETWNNGWAYRNDGVDIEECTDDTTNGFNVGWIESGESLKFTIDVESDGVYDLIVRYAADNGNGQIRFALDGQFLTQA